MTQSSLAARGRVAQKIAEIGSCLELVPMDPHFGGVSVGLYVKDGVCTVWSFSRAEGVGETFAGHPRSDGQASVASSRWTDRATSSSSRAG